jgi:regulator of protease activity HflC (stomatin/prohibitin superfamily)
VIPAPAGMPPVQPARPPHETTTPEHNHLRPSASELLAPLAGDPAAGGFPAIGVFTSFYTVGPESVAVVQRFGKFSYTADRGLHFKRINYKSGVIGEIYARMSSERLQIAERFRSEGAGEAAKIIGRRERDLLSIESGAYRTEQEIKGKADAEATGIYAAAYSSSPAAADFYQFTKTLETYQKALGKDSTLILTSDSELFRLFKHMNQPAAK